jgi:hypothetical protein
MANYLLCGLDLRFRMLAFESILTLNLVPCRYPANINNVGHYSPGRKVIVYSTQHGSNGNFDDFVR